MCFSASASFESAAFLGIIGYANIRKMPTLRHNSLAIVPLFFAAQQTIEGLIWMNLNPLTEDFDSILIGPKILTYLFSFLSFVFWPTFLSFAVLEQETDKLRKYVLKCLLLMGILTSSYYLWLIVKNPIYSWVRGSHISYNLILHPPMIATTFYGLATVMACLLSSFRWINVFGIVSLGSMIYTHIAYPLTFASVWCFFAAILSGTLCLHFSSVQVSSKRLENELTTFERLWN